MGNEYKRRIVTSGEQDLYTGWRRIYCYLQNHNKARRKIKRATHRRERKELRRDLAERRDDV